MAITFNTDRLQGLEGTTINGVYARIQSVTVKKYDAETNPSVAVQWKCLYDVVLHATAVKETPLVNLQNGATAYAHGR